MDEIYDDAEMDRWIAGVRVQVFREFADAGVSLEDGMAAILREGPFPVPKPSAQRLFDAICAERHHP
ncbi:hypothetical protein [Nocardia tengchongensis]|uniref:hypothetical protein n=1 Tax=Nocardia tengchongensis TaxID=2055889 RepID=UPI0036520B96